MTRNKWNLLGSVAVLLMLTISVGCCPNPTDTPCDEGGCCAADMDCSGVEGICCDEGETCCDTECTGGCKPLTECLT